MRLSRYGLLGITMVVATFVLILLQLAPRPERYSTTRRLSHLGTILDVYCFKNGRMPPSLAALAGDGLLAPDQFEALDREVRFVAAGRQRDKLSDRAIVALQDPAPVAGSIPVIVLLADGSVLPVPADAVRDAVARRGPPPVLESAADGQLRAAAAAAPGQ